MAEQEELGRFLVGLASKIPNIITRGLQNVCFTNQLPGLLTVITAQGVSQVVDSFHGEPTKVTYKYPAGSLLVITFQVIWLNTQKIAWDSKNPS